MKQHDEEHVKAVVGSGNIFADLGLENADELLVKADLAHAINAEIRSCGYAQAEVVKRTGLTQSDVSKIGRMKTDGFSQERLQKVLIQFGVESKFDSIIAKMGKSAHFEFSKQPEF